MQETQFQGFLLHIFIVEYSSVAHKMAGEHSAAKPRLDSRLHYFCIRSRSPKLSNSYDAKIICFDIPHCSTVGYPIIEKNHQITQSKKLPTCKVGEVPRSYLQAFMPVFIDHHSVLWPPSRLDVAS